MHHTFALIAGLGSLGLACALYYVKLRAHPRSWLRSDILVMNMIALLTGLFPMALAGSLVGLWKALASGVSLPALASAGADMVSLVAALATVVVFRALVRQIHLAERGPAAATPFVRPSPTPSPAAPRRTRKAA